MHVPSTLLCEEKVVKNVFRFLACVAALTALQTSAIAAPGAPDSTTITRPAGTTVVSRVLPQGAKEIYSTFNTDPDNAYDCCNGWTISAPGSIVGARQDVAMPFTPDKNYAVKTVTVAVGYVTGTNGVTISLNQDAGGVPGAVIKRGRVTGLPSFGSCCVTASIGTKGAAVAAGTTYWVVVNTDKKSADTWNAWNWNNVGMQGAFAFNNGTGWQASSGTLAAFSVAGKP
jgi:hypothetical protein